MAEDVRIPVPISSITFVLRGRGRKKVLKLRSIAYRYPMDEERNVWGIWRGIVAVLDAKKTKEIPITLEDREGLLEVNVRPGKEHKDIKRYLKRVFGKEVRVKIRPSPTGYHVVIRTPADHPLIQGLLEVAEREGIRATYGVHALLNPDLSPLGWVPYLLKRFETLDITPRDLLKFARNAEEAELALKRIRITAQTLEAVLGYLKTAKELAKSAGTGPAIKYLRQVRDRKLLQDGDHILALVLDDVIRVITKHPRPERGMYAQKERSRKWTLRVLKRAIRKLELVKNNMVGFLEKSGGGT